MTVITLDPTCRATSLRACLTASVEPCPSKMIDPPGPPRMSTLALERLEMSRKVSRNGFLSWLRESICDGASRSCSMCFPGRLMIFGVSEGPNPWAKRIMSVQERDTYIWLVYIHLCEPMATPLATAAARDGLLAPQVVGAAGLAGFGLGPLPKAGKDSSE